MSVKGTLVEDKMRRFMAECAHFSFNKCPIYTHDGASVKFSTKSHEMDNSEGGRAGSHALGQSERNNILLFFTTLYSTASSATFQVLLCQRMLELKSLNSGPFQHLHWQ